MMDEQMPMVGTKPEGGWSGRQAKGMDRRRYVALLSVGVLASAVLMGALVAWGWVGGAGMVLTSLVSLLWMAPLAVLRLRYLGQSAWGAVWLFLPLFGDLFLIVWAVMGLEKRKALAWGFGGAALYLVVFGVSGAVGEVIWWDSVLPESGVTEFGVTEFGCDDLLRQQLMASPLATENVDNANAVVAGIQAQRPSDCGYHSWRSLIVQVNRTPDGAIDLYFSPREGGVRWVYLPDRGTWYEGVGNGGLVPSAGLR